MAKWISSRSLLQRCWVLLLCFSGAAGTGTALHAASLGEVQSLVEETRDPRVVPIVFQVRLPVGLAEGQSPRGVMALLSWHPEPEGAVRNLSEGGHFGHLVALAARNGLAVVTWNNFKGYEIGTSADTLDRQEFKEFDRAYAERLKEWERGWKRTCRKFDLPRENLLAYGLSGGGQMVHRIALRHPEYFFAVHMHVNSSYDALTDEGKSVLWLVTTGTLEYGYGAARRFYREAMDREYAMIFKAEENLGHAQSPGINRLSEAFFQFCLPFVPDASDPDWREPPEDVFYFMRHPMYVGDWVNNEAFPVERAATFVDPEAMVSLPTRAIAKAWGDILEPRGGTGR